MKFPSFTASLWFLGLGITNFATPLSADCENKLAKYPNAILRHASKVQFFGTTDRGVFATKDASFPSGAAYFSIDNIDFSIQAGMSSDLVSDDPASFYLHTYKAARFLHLLECKNPEDLRAHLIQSKYRPGRDDIANSNILCEKEGPVIDGGVDGILILEDDSRQENELILCIPSVTVHKSKDAVKYKTFAFTPQPNDEIKEERRVEEVRCAVDPEGSYYAIDFEDPTTVISGARAKSLCTKRPDKK